MTPFVEQVMKEEGVSSMRVHRITRLSMRLRQPDTCIFRGKLDNDSGVRWTAFAVNGIVTQAARIKRGRMLE